MIVFLIERRRRHNKNNARALTHTRAHRHTKTYSHQAREGEALWTSTKMIHTMPVHSVTLRRGRASENPLGFRTMEKRRARKESFLRKLRKRVGNDENWKNLPKFILRGRWKNEKEKKPTKIYGTRTQRFLPSSTVFASYAVNKTKCVVYHAHRYRQHFVWVLMPMCSPSIRTSNRVYSSSSSLYKRKFLIVTKTFYPLALALDCVLLLHSKMI